jgi:hypothetical protein
MGTGERKMKKMATIVIISILCLSMLPILKPAAKAEPSEAYLTNFLQLTTNSMRDRSPICSPDGSRIAYFAFDSSDWYRHIWTMNPDGSGKTQITFGGVIDETGDYSPDSTKIAFMRYRGSGIFDIWIMDSDGTDAHALTSTGLYHGSPRWSHDGQRLAFYYGSAGTNVCEIHIMNADGTNELTVVSSSYNHMNVFWSSDDTKLFYTMDDGIWFVNTSPPYTTTRLYQTSLPTMHVTCSPDGEYILYASGVWGQYQNLYLIDANGNFIAQLTEDTSIEYAFDWSPDGQNIFFSSIRSGNTDIWRAKIVMSGGGPVGYWKFDEGSGTIAHDSSGNGNDGVIHTATWTDGIVGKALHFNGVDSWVEVPNSPTLTGLSQITVEAWIQEDSITAQLKGIVSKCDGWAPPTNAEYFLGTNENGKVFFETDHGTAIFSAQTTPLITEAGRWYHVAGTWSGDTYTIYVDGAPVLSGICTPQTTLSNTLPVQIGRHGSWSWVYFQGVIDEVKIYNYGRTGEEIESDFKENAGLAGYWKFDEGSGTVASDSSGNGNIGTLYNGPQWVSGVVGNALRFDGSNDYVRIPHSSSLDITGNEISVEFWMKLTNGWHPEPGASYIYDQILYDKGDAYTSAMIKSTGALRFNIPYVPPYPETNKNNWDANTWYHIAEVFDGAQIRIYVNGVLDKAETVIGSVSRSTINLALGSHCFGGAHFFNGAIDEFAIYNYARTAEEIQTDYHSVVRGPVGYWRFDEGSAYDSSGNGNTGVVNGAAWVDGIKGEALQFDGIDDFVSVSHSSSLDIAGNEISVEYWMKLPNGWYSGAGSYDQILYDKGDAYTACMVTANGRHRFNIPYLPPYPETNKNTWDANVWYHIADVFDGNQIRIYVNGVLDKTETVIGPVSRSGLVLAIGSHCFGDSHFFNGYIDDFAIYDYARTAEEILNDYNSVSGSLFEDDFENYVVGTFPPSGGWELVYDGAGSQYQIVTDAYCNSPIRSLQLLGTNGWSANVQRKFTSDSSLLGYEAYMLAQSNTGSADHVGQIAFWNLQGAPWGKRLAVVQFDEDGNLYTAPVHLGPVYVNMGPYEANRWYHVKVLIDREAGKYSVWIDDSLKAADIAIPDTYEINALELESGHAGVKVFYDDVRVFTGSATPPPANQKPVAILSVDPEIANMGNDVWFYGTESYDPDGSVAAYFFEFGDGQNSGWLNYPTVAATHPYDTQGEYWSKLKVRDNSGLESDWSTEVKVTVLPPPQLQYDVTVVAHCNTEGVNVGVSIWLDYSSMYYTPHTYTGLSGTHTLTASQYDTSSHPFKQWSTGSTSLTMPIASGGTYTAYYEAANRPPSVPTINGPTFCTIYDKDNNYLGPWTYTATSSDPDGGNVKLTFSWDDGTPDQQSGAVSSGFPVQESHSWVPNTGMHKIRAKATDTFGAESDWSVPLVITVVAQNRLTNWAGYFVKASSSNDRVTSVSGEWVQPTFRVPEGTSFQGTWVGIGGVDGSKLLQAGIAEIKWWKVGSESPAFVPFWMTVGEGQPWISYWIDYTKTADPGDTISVTIVEDAQRDGFWHIQVKDTTKNWIYSADVEFTPDQTTADWIHEPGAGATGVASFDPITFSEAEFVMNGVSYRAGRIDPSVHTYLFMANYIKDGQVLTSVSPISDYERFTISYTGPGPIAANQVVLLSLHSSCELHVYDSAGNCLGFNATSGFFVSQIEGAILFEDGEGVQYAILLEPDSYRIELVGKESGDFHLHIQTFSEDIVILDEWINGTTSQGAMETHHLYVPPQGTPVVDDTPPTTQLIIGEPKCVAPTQTYVTKDSLFTLTAGDGTGSGVAETAYRISNSTYDSGWTRYAAPFNLTSLSDGNYTLAFNSTDKAGNIETTNKFNLTLFSWTFVFHDSDGRGTTLKINTQYKLFQFTAPAKDFGVRNDPKMTVLKNVIVICYNDGTMRLVAAAVVGRLDSCAAVTWDKQTGKTYWLIDTPNWRGRNDCFAP